MLLLFQRTMDDRNVELAVKYFSILERCFAIPGP